MQTVAQAQKTLREMVFGVNTAALVEALFEMGINPDIVTTVVAGRYDELRQIVFGQIGTALAAGGVSRELPKDIPSLVEAYRTLALNGNLIGEAETENVSDNGFTYKIKDCMFCATRDILMARHPESPPPCFISALMAGIVQAASGRTATPDSVEVVDGVCKFVTSVE